MNNPEWQRWECIFCGHIYSEKAGDLRNKVEPGTRWEDMPDDWFCPDCGEDKADFDPI